MTPDQQAIRLIIQLFRSVELTDDESMIMDKLDKYVEYLEENQNDK